MEFFCPLYSICRFWIGFSGDFSKNKTAVPVKYSGFIFYLLEHFSEVLIEPFKADLTFCSQYGNVGGLSCCRVRELKK